VHRVDAQVESLDAKAGSVTLAHGPVASLKWPPMTMEFQLANPSLAASLKPGAKVAVEFVERAPGEWVVTAVKPAPAPGHAGH
jgi:Cu/Ag efflux protein CusF